MDNIIDAILINISPLEIALSSLLFYQELLSRENF